MIIGLGIDAVEIDRFKHWHTFSHKQLTRIFSPEEISYCLQHLSAQRFAARFATREAFFKAWNAAYPNHYVPLLTTCKAISLTHDKHNTPILTIHWNLLPNVLQQTKPLISLTHTRTTATACVILRN